METFLILGSVFSGLAAIGFIFYRGAKSGRDAEVRESLENTADDVYTAKVTLERFRSDADYATRVQDRFER